MVRKEKQKQYSPDLEYNFKKEINRVLYTGETGHKGKIGTVQTSNANGNRYGVSFRHNHRVYIDGHDLVPLILDNSIPDGTKMTECCARPFKQDQDNYMSDDAMGKPYKIRNAYKGGIVVEADDEEFGYKYFITHGCYKIVPNYKTAWVWKNFHLKKQDLMFNNFEDGTLTWKTSKGELIADRIVRDDITNALDMGRFYLNKESVEVHR